MIATIKYKEVGMNHIGKTSYNGDNITKEKMIEFFGLNQPDVEWFEITFENN